MTVYVVTRCAAEENYTPHVFTDYEKAKRYFDNMVEECTNEELYVDHSEIYQNNAEIIYTDDTYDVINIFEVEVE